MKIRLNSFLSQNSHLLFPVMSGLLLTASFPLVSIPYAAWAAIVPLLWSIRNKSGLKAFSSGLAAGLVHNLTLLYWLVSTLSTYGYMPKPVSAALLALLCLYLAIFPAVFAWGVTLFCRIPFVRVVMVPLLWVSLEYFRSFLFTGFPWEFVGYSQHNFSALIQMADITGVYGVSFLVILFNTAVFLTALSLAGERWNGFEVKGGSAAAGVAITVSVLAGALVYGNMSIERVDRLAERSPKLSVAVVQGNINQAQKWDSKFMHSSLEKYLELSEMSDDQSELVVWPETALPFYYPGTRTFVGKINQAVSESGKWYLVGAPSYKAGFNSIRFYNSAFLISPQGILSGSYEKVHLVPFGEYVPLRRILGFLDKIVVGAGDFSAGEKGNIIEWEGKKAGVQICFEIIFPGLSSAMVNNGANFLINMTNDAWFGESSAPFQHFSMVKFRAVENRRAVARAANTGISGFIDPVGRVMESSGLFSDEVLVESLPLVEDKTFYTRNGDIFALLCVVLCLFGGFCVWFLKLRGAEKKV